MNGIARKPLDYASFAGADPLPIKKAEELRDAMNADDTAYLHAVDEFVRTVRSIAESNGVVVSGIIGINLSLDGVTVIHSRSLTASLPSIP